MLRKLILSLALCLTAPIAFGFGGPNPSPNPIPPDGTWEHPYLPDECSSGPNGNPVVCPGNPVQQAIYSWNVFLDRVGEFWYDPTPIGGFSIETSGGLINNLRAPKKPSAYDVDPVQFETRLMGIGIIIPGFDPIALRWDESFPISETPAFKVVAWSATYNHDYVPVDDCFNCLALPPVFALGLTINNDDGILTKMGWSSIPTSAAAVPEPSSVWLFVAGLGFLLLVVKQHRQM